MAGRSPGSDGGRPSGSIAGLRVTVCCEPDASFDGWMRELRRARLEVTHIWPPPGRLSPGMDILISDYFPEIDDLVPWHPGDAKAAFIILLPQNSQYDDDIVVSATPHGLLQRPFPDRLIRVAAMVAWSQFRYEKRLRERVSRLDENLRAIRDVERAKLIIMAEKNLDEDAAYRHLRQLAMQRQLTVAALASAIVQSHGQLG